MSGHSKWSTIKRKKGANDQARGKLFSKLARSISSAVKTGGGPDPEFNHKLRMAIDQAKSANMPNDNIDRAISSADKSSQNLEEITYEGFGPHGVGVIVEVLTDNRNRTAQELKTMFDRAGGNLAGPGAVSFQFSSKGKIFIEINSNEIEDTLLKLIDLGVEDYNESDGGVVVYVNPAELFEYDDQLKQAGFKTSDAELIQKPNITQKLDQEKTTKAIKFLEDLSDHEDVQKVFANLED